MNSPDLVDCYLPGDDNISDEEAQELLHNYEMKFDLLLDVPDAVEHFTQYLKRSFNEEALIFCIAVRSIRTLPDAQKFNTINDIYDEHIKEGSPQEINIDASVRREIHQRLNILQVLLGEIMEQAEVERQTVQPNNGEEITGEATAPPTKPEPSYNIFEDVHQIIIRELKEDAFPRYVRSEDFFDLVKKKGSKMVKLIGANITEEGRNALVYRPRDFKSDVITDKDIIFILKLNEDSPGNITYNLYSFLIDWEHLWSFQNQCGSMHKDACGQ
jgi:hypothetical protein